MKKFNKTKLVSVILTLSCTAVLLAFAATSVAWLSTNRKTTGGGMKVAADLNSDLVDINFKLYKYDYDKKEATEYTQGSEDFDLDLKDYDNFIRERNIYNSNILRFTVAFPTTMSSESSSRKIAISVKLNSTTIGNNFNGGFTDGVSRTYVDTTGYKYKNASKSRNYTCNNISNIIYFKGFAYTYVLNNQTYKVDSEIDIDESNATSIYEDVTSYLEQKSNKSTFFVSGSKSNEVQFYLENINGKATSAEFYVEYNYASDLVDSFLHDTEIVGSQDTSMMSSKIAFQKDIDKIRVSSQETAINA